MALAMRQVEHVLVVALRFVFPVFKPYVGSTVQCDAIPWEYALAVSGRRSPFQVNTSLCVGVRRVLVGAVVSFLTFVLPLFFASDLPLPLPALGFPLTPLLIFRASSACLGRARYSSRAYSSRDLHRLLEIYNLCCCAPETCK